MSVTITSAKFPVFTKTGDIDILIEVNGEWLPFTASQDDTEAHGKDLYNRIIAGEFGAIAEYKEIILPKKDCALEAIKALELRQTPRRLREAILEIADKVGAECTFLRDIEDSIAKKRVDLV